ncbi:MAG: SMC-Scp complex subunit ScpB [Ruminococcaceae bacterium]|nr:SMC-Scp complex subunit ScpB [Oscillospiraceae bacterium]
MATEEILENAAEATSAEENTSAAEKAIDKLEDELQPIKNVEACIEAVVFAAGYPVPYQKLAEVTGLGVRDVKRLVDRIAKSYVNDKHGIMMLKFDKTCQFCTKEQYGTYIREALGIRRGGNLSASSMEVLAVVAYNQPVTRAFIDAVRGVDSNYAVNSLIDKELIASVGRLDAPGRPLLYGTTDKFLRVFGLNSLEDLPETETMLPDNGAGDQLSIDTDEEGAEVEEKDPDQLSIEPEALPAAEGEAPTATAAAEEASEEAEAAEETAEAEGEEI